MPNRSPKLACFLRRAVLVIATTLPLMGLLAWPAQAVPVYRLTDLRGGEFSRALAINDPGQIVGEEAGRATLFDPTGGGDNRDLGTLGGDRSSANAINDSGRIVGFAEIAADERRAFLFETGTMFDLNDLIDPNDPLFGQVVLTNANDINAAGAIVANQELPSGSRAFLLTPL